MRGPIPNSYQLLDGRLIAGVLTGDRDEAAVRAKLGALLDAGVTTFIDLTEPRELEPYEHQVAKLARGRGREVKYHRLPIRDVSVPKSAAVMRQILDQIDAALDDGGVVYVHCWGGIGRTGTVVGCHLVRSGMTGDEALAEVTRLFRHMDKYPKRPRSPETDEQECYVRAWSEVMPNANRQTNES